MKKFLTLVLALVMVCSLSVTAFAEEGTTTLTANIPNAAEPSFTLHIPADTTLTYGDTDLQQVSGVLYSTDIQNASAISCEISHTNLINTADSGDYIQVNYWTEAKIEGSSESEWVSLPGTQSVYLLMYNGKEVKHTLYAKVADWSGATPGATYQAVITFTASAT